MRFHVVTIFPGFFQGPLDHGILRRAIERGLVSVTLHDLRDHTTDRHRTVDDTPLGGGGGMVMKAPPIVACLTSILKSAPRARPLLLSPQGEALDQPLLSELALEESVILVCGRYEGVDERVRQIVPCREVSVGDFVLSGGEIAACIVMDGVTRLIPGALHCEHGSAEESFTTGLLDHPQYTRPLEVAGVAAPAVLLSGHHEQVRLHRRKAALLATLARRPDLLAALRLDREDRRLLEEIRAEIRAAAGTPGGA